MDIRRSHTPKGVSFTTIYNSVIEDEQLSGDALAVLVYLLSKPPGWVIRQADIRRRFGWGDASWRAACRDLVSAGYLTRERTKDAGGKIAWQHTIYDLPQGRDFDMYGRRGKKASQDDAIPAV